MPASFSREIIQAGVRRGRIDAAHDAGDEDRGADTTAHWSVVGDGDGEDARTASGAGERRVAEGRAGGVRVLAGDAADGERVAAVGRDIDLDGGVVEGEQADRIGSHGRVEVEFGQSQDAVVLVAESEFARRGDHPIGDMAVGLAGGDRERAGQHGSGQGHDDLVSDEEVACAADDAVHGVAAIGRRLALWGDAHLAPTDGLAVGLRFLDELEDLAHDDGTAQLEAVHVLLFEADAHEGLVQRPVVVPGTRSTYSANQLRGTLTTRPPFRTAG